MSSSDWALQAHNQYYYTADQLRAISTDIAQRLEYDGGAVKGKKGKSRGVYELRKKDELVKLAKAKGIVGANNLKKSKLIAKLRAKR